MYLHKEDRELLHDMIVMVSEKSGMEENIVEKDTDMEVLNVSHEVWETLRALVMV